MNDRYFEIYKIVNSIPGKIVRLILFLGSIALIILNIQNPKPLVAIFAFILINELFLESLSKIKPKSLVTDKTPNIYDCIIFQARSKIEGTNVYKIVNRLNSSAVKFFKSEVNIKSVGKTNVTKDEFLKQAQELVSWVHGQYITEIDLFVAYILLSESETQFLQKNNLNNDDVVNILYWSRNKFLSDKFQEGYARLIGGGVFDNLATSWNYELKKYARDLTSEVLSNRFLPTIAGLEKEFDELTVALSKDKSSNALVIGEAGSGTRALIEYLTYASFIGKTTEELYHKKVYELFVEKLLSGVDSAGAFEERLSLLLSEISHSGESIVFIQNIENIFGGGGLAFDISGVLDEYLHGDKIKLVGTTTPSGFANFIEPKATIAASFDRVVINELPPGKVMLLLTDKVAEVESRYKLKIRYQALKQVIILAPVFFPDRSYPGSALDLLEEVASKARADKKKVIDGPDVISVVQEKTNIVLEDPEKDEREKLIHLEERLHQRIIGQDEAVKVVADAMRRVRSGFSNKNRPIAVFLFLGPTGVGKTETSKALAAEYFGEKSPMIRLDMSEYQTQEQIKRLLGESPGQEFIPNTLTDLVEKQPFSLVLLDEFEKAHPELLNLFLQVFDEGRLTDNRGKTVFFKNTIIIATSNAGTELLREKGSRENVTKDQLVDELLKHNIFHPELLNRFDEVVLFKSLTQDEIAKIAALLLKESLASLEDNEIKIEFDEKVTAKIAQESYSPEFGGRNIRRYIEEHVENYISKLILEDKIKKGGHVMLSVDDAGNFIVT